MKKRKRIIYSCLYAMGITALIIWLIFSTSVISRYASEQNVVETDFNNYSGRKYVQCAIDTIQVQDSLTDNFQISGWGFISTDVSNENRKFSLLMNNDEKCYELPAILTTRNDVAEAFPNIVKIPKVGYYFNGSMLTIQNGTYDLYAYCWENTDEYGLTDIHYQLEKTNDTVKVKLWKSTTLETVKVPFGAAPSTFSLDRVILRGDMITFEGWCYINGLNCENQKVYVEILDEAGQVVQYTAKQVLRGDVSTLFDNKLYEKSGYFAAIPTENITDGIYTVKILVEYDGLLQVSPPYAMTKASDKITWTKAN